MPANFEQILREQCKLTKDRPILAGVSGGPDSLCLLSLLHEAGYQVIAAHFNHQLRPEAAGEAEAVEALAMHMHVPFVAGAGDVPRYAEQQKLSIETAARDLRYRFLFEQAHRHNAQAVAVGHTADDQVETVLMHFLRGAGLNGLKGMPYCSFLDAYDNEIPLIRPLLDMWRAETVAYCSERGLEPHYDLSNDSTEFLRNKLRHELIPRLETYNPRFREAAWRAGKALSADHELLTAVLESVWQKALLRQGEAYLELDGDSLSAQPRAAQMHILRRAAHHLLPDCEVGFDALERAASFVADASQERVDFVRRLFLLREGRQVYMTSDAANLPWAQWPQMADGIELVPFSVPCRIGLASGWAFSASSEPHPPESWKEVNPLEAWVDSSVLSMNLQLRVRRSGDRFEPLGMDGHSQKLSDFFVNAKLPARARERWPLVCAGDEVIWVPGYRPAESARVGAETKTSVHLQVSAPPVSSD